MVVVNLTTTETKEENTLKIADCMRTLSQLSRLTDSAIALVECSQPDTDAAAEIVAKIASELSELLKRVAHSSLDTIYPYDTHEEVFAIASAVQIMGDGGETMAHSMNLLHVLKKHFTMFTEELLDAEIIATRGKEGNKC